MSYLYIVSTPIGNLKDITLRAIEVLNSVDFILCEDTRVTKKLLDKYEIKTKTLSYHSHSKVTKTNKIIKLLEEGENLALVSDAGTPTVSDPGSMLVHQAKEHLGDEVQVVPIPGASALTTALSACNLPTHQFTFLGFMPHKKGRETLFKEISESKRAMVFYESPHRIMKTLNSLVEFCPEKKVCIARELTKIYEEFTTATPAELIKFYEKNPDKARGEFTVIVV